MLKNVFTLGVFLSFWSSYGDSRASPGVQVGTTWYDYQHHGTISKMIINEGTGTNCPQPIQYVWMNGLDNMASNRHVFHNYGNPPVDNVGLQIDPGSISRSGFITMDVLSNGKAVAAYYARLSSWPATDIASAVSVDLIECLSAFNLTWVDTVTLSHAENVGPIWPHVSVDAMDNIHVVASRVDSTPGVPMTMWYSRSTNQGLSFSPWVLVEDSLYNFSYDVQTSRSSGKVAIAYTKAVPWDPNRLNQDVHYFESTDFGATWDFTTSINVTNFSSLDTLRAFTDVSAIYDSDDSLNLAFSLRHTIGDTLFTSASLIMLWSKNTGMSVINSDPLIGWHSQYDAGKNRLMADRPSLGISLITGELFCVFVGNPPGDTSAAGLPNGELYLSCPWMTMNSGWFTFNLTNTPSPGCTPGNCEDDDYPSLAEIVDDNLHILYVNDKDAGAAPYGEGTWTENPVLYLKDLDPCGVGVEEEDAQSLSRQVRLFQNTPNPFLRETSIGFSLSLKSMVNLTVYDIAGRKVNRVIEGEMDAGIHTFRWKGVDDEGREVTSGIYFYRLNVGENDRSHSFTQTRKMVVLR